jgi:membrane protein
MSIVANKKIKWIDVAKFFAIFGVLVDHTVNILYFNLKTQYKSFYAVSLFIIISGMLSYISNLKHKNEKWGENILRNVSKILLSYSIATLFYLIFSFGYLDMYTYIQTYIHFNASGPLYFVLLYIQMMIFNKILYDFLYKFPKNKKGYLMEIYMFFIIVIFSFITVRFTNIFNIYGGGGKILGGTFLILYYLGMLISKHKWLKKRNVKKLLWVSLFFIVLWLIISNNMISSIKKIDLKLIPVPANLVLNPPGITLILYSIVTLIMIYGIINILENIKIFNKIINFMAFIGKHTLYIFLYHRLILDKLLTPYIYINNIWIKRIVYLSLMIGISIIIEYLINYFIRKFKKIVSN